MSRCDYDGMFYRVFCVTLLATAFTFTVILTNVFIDIDGLLAKKGKQNHETTDNVEYKENIRSSEATNPPDDTTENVYDKNYIDDQTEPTYRTKRSIDSRNIVSNYHKNKINVLAAQLTKLLENIDNKGEIYPAEFNRKEENIDIDLAKIPFEEYFSNYNIGRKKETPEKDLHLAIHRLPQENIIENVDDNEISKTISKALKNYNSRGYTNIQAKDPEVVMKTIIEIKPLDIIEVKNKISNSQEKMKSPNKIKYKYLPNLQNIDKENLSIDEHKTVLKLKILGPNSRHEKNYESHRIFEVIPKHDQYYYLSKALEYLRKYSTYNKEQFAFVRLDKSNKDRMKRQIKVRYEDYDATTPKIKPVRKATKKADDELYVEIETHFDGSGAKGERKKKLVKSLIDRIQKAIRSDELGNSDKKKTHEHLQIKKRIQNPLKHKPKNIMKMSSVEHRQQNPINKIEEVKDVLQDGEVKSVDDLEEPDTNPNSFSAPNIENSAEAENSEFNNILSSGIPQRVQVPINLRQPDMPGKLKNSYADAGNVTLFIKDIDGSGFSVGFNQYVDEPPDVDSMKLFSGLENLIKTYHEDYDQNNNENNNVNEIEASAEKQHELMKRDVNADENRHILFRRSIQEVQNDYRSDAYNFIFDKKMLPYDRYEDVLNRPSHKTIPSDYEYKIRNYDYNPKNIKIFTKDIKIKALPIVLNDEKKMRPSEIFSLANLLIQDGKNREKRSLNVQKITNLKSRIKLARYINTKKMESKSLFFKNNRNKRNVDKIRIFTSDQSRGPSRQSEENVYVLSGENFFTNRASLREIELPESDTGADGGGEQHGDGTVPFVFDEPYSNSPNKEQDYITNIFDTKYSQNGLMSKYPHIFPGTARDSKEVQFTNDNEFLFKRDNKQQLKLENLLGMREGDNDPPEKDGRIPDIVNAISPSKNNYKVTVKILPKNLTNAPSGFKEMHTVINKTYNNNGLQYYSLVNVSEISKIEKINKTKENEHIDDNSNNNNKSTDDAKKQEQEKNMKLLLALQKEKIEKQLLYLNKEKEGLESILRGKDGIKERNIHDLFKDFMHLESNKPNDDMEFLHDMSHLQVHNTATVEPITESNIIVPITNHDIRIKLEAPKEPEINKIETVKEKDNEHLTNEILSQINKNTDILQCFLKKLSDKFEQTPSQTTRNPVERVTEENHLRAHPDLKDWGLHQLHDTFFNDHIHKNESQYAIPFVYAYQHPYLPPNKPPLPMAKIVYHGHIHTNNLHKYGNDGRKYNSNSNNFKHNHPTTKPSVNHEGNTFFIDSLARDVIVTPSKIVQKTDYPAPVVNVTQIH
ncbi:hypothetical protein RR48_06543 [Papilio machaon]|uniref:Uncharacterized protein n=1 Tax=Papilio machaon TaxID=76193 RepID=A0A194RPA8_PAPMA|nr:hypothetical protein RR48_06543 [Papilio machaon]